jgi:hypothetical protein
MSSKRAVFRPTIDAYAPTLYPQCFARASRRGRRLSSQDWDATERILHRFDGHRPPLPVRAGMALHSTPSPSRCALSPIIRRGRRTLQHVQRIIVLKLSTPPTAASSRRREQGGDRECQSYKYSGSDLRDRSGTPAAYDKAALADPIR